MSGLCLPLRACSCWCARVSPVSPRVPVFHTKHRPRVVYACRCVLARVVARACPPYLPVSPCFTPNTARSMPAAACLLVLLRARVPRISPCPRVSHQTPPPHLLTRALLFSNSVFVLLL